MSDAPGEVDLRTRLGADLWRLVRQMRPPVVEVARLTTLHAPGLRRASFLLRNAVGERFKGRRLESAADAARVQTLLERLAPWRFPRVVARHRAALVLEWIEGTRLDPACRGRELLLACGALHGVIHSLEAPADLVHPARRAADASQHTLGRNLTALVKAGMLAPEEAGALFDLAARLAPARVDVGIVHRDVCAENIVVPVSGQPVLVDNESLAVGPYDYDLARTWWRWPMDSGERAAYFEGYERYRGATGFRRHRRYWTLLALVGAAAFHLRARSGDRVAAWRLRALTNEADRLDTEACSR